MRIPKSFQIGSYTVPVSIVSAERMTQLAGEYCDPVDEDEEVVTPWGLFVPGTLHIYVQELSKGLSKQKQLQAFWHEVFHALFFALNQDLTDDEVLVDQCGMLMVQIQQSMKY